MFSSVRNIEIDNSRSEETRDTDSWSKITVSIKKRKNPEYGVTISASDIANQFDKQGSQKRCQQAQTQIACLDPGAQNNAVDVDH